MNIIEIIRCNHLKIESVILTESEQKESDFEGKKRKYFKSQHSAYWIEKENKKIKERHVTNL